jgi:cytochrome P450
MSLIPYGDRWRRQHKIFHQFFHTEGIESFKGTQLLEARRLLVGLLDSPRQFRKHLQRYALLDALAH